MKRSVVLIALLIVAAAGISNYSAFFPFTEEYQVAESYPDIPSSEYRIAFYNVENLFDYEHDAGKEDYEYLPGGDKQWDKERYRKKLDNIARVLMAVKDFKGPEVIGLAEVENRRVLTDLINHPKVKKAGYRIIHEESPDPRGIDVAMLYKADRFKPLHVEYIPVPLKGDAITRDILHVRGELAGKDTVHLFFNHWSSRWGGVAQSQPKRLSAARVLRNRVDELYAKDSCREIITGGDFNDNPDNKSIIEVLGAKPDTSRQLFNPMYRLYKTRDMGSQRYKEHWNVFDQIICSRAILDTGDAYFYKKGSAAIFTPDWLIRDHPYLPGKTPYRTFSGGDYLGGYSDHFPVYIDLKLAGDN